MGAGMRMAAGTSLSAKGFTSRRRDPDNPDHPASAHAWTHRDTGETFEGLEPEALAQHLYERNREALERLALPTPLRRRFAEAGLQLSLSGNVLGAGDGRGAWASIALGDLSPTAAARALAAELDLRGRARRLSRDRCLAEWRQRRAKGRGGFFWRGRYHTPDEVTALVEHLLVEMLDDHGPALEHLDWAPYLAEGGPWPFVHAIVQNGPWTLDEMLDWCPFVRPDMVFCLVWHVVRLTEGGLDRASELRGRLDALANQATL